MTEKRPEGRRKYYQPRVLTAYVAWYGAGAAFAVISCSTALNLNMAMRLNGFWHQAPWPWSSVRACEPERWWFDAARWGAVRGVVILHRENGDL